MSWQSNNEHDEPGFLDTLVAAKFPLLAMLGVFGEGPKRAYEQIAPLLAIVFLIGAAIFCIASLFGS